MIEKILKLIDVLIIVYFITLSIILFFNGHKFIEKWKYTNTCGFLLLCLKSFICIIFEDIIFSLMYLLLASLYYFMESRYYFRKKRYDTIQPYLKMMKEI